MPTYEYRCRDCGHSFDIVQKMSDDALTHCPECGGELRKVFAPPAISFKGSGFYATDHGKKSKTSASGDAKKDSGPKDAKGPDATGSSSSGSKDSGSKDAGSKDSSGSSDTKKDTASNPKKEGSS
mgnify:CR=1 FL=1